MSKTKLSKEEQEFVIEKAKEGHGYTDIANLLDNKVTKQRIKQICKKANIDAFAIKQKNKNVAYEERMVAKWGVNWNNKEHRRSYVYQIMRSKFRTKKANAKHTGRNWTVDFGELDFPTHCPILGIELNYFSEVICDNSPSFDCVIPERGYVKGNVYVISQRANRIKNDGTAQEHYAIAKFIDAVSTVQPSA